MGTRDDTPRRKSVTFHGYRKVTKVTDQVSTFKMPLDIHSSDSITVFSDSINVFFNFNYCVFQSVNDSGMNVEWHFECRDPTCNFCNFL